MRLLRALVLPSRRGRLGARVLVTPARRRRRQVVHVLPHEQRSWARHYR